MNVSDLFREYSKNRSHEIRNEIVQNYLYLVDILIKKYINRGVDYEDLYQVGALALITAVERYDPEKGFDFKTFATPTIVGEIKKYFRDKGFSIKIPRNIQAISKKTNEAIEKLNKQLHRAPYIKEIAEYLNYSEEEVLEGMESSKVYFMQSLDIPLELEDGSSLSIGDILGEEDIGFHQVEQLEFVRKVTETFSEQESKLFKLRFLENMTQRQIAEIFGVSQMTISRIERKISQKFKSRM